MPTVTAEYQIAGHLQRTLERANIGADDLVAGGTERHHLALHLQCKIGVVPRLRGEKVETVPLRHERDKLGPRRQVSEVGERGLQVTKTAAQAVGFFVRALQEAVVEAEFVEDFQGRWVHSVAAE